MIQTDLKVAFQASADLQSFAKRSGHNDIYKMLNEAISYYKYSLTPDIQIISVNEAKNTYTEIFGNLHRPGLQTIKCNLLMKNAQKIFAFKRQTGVETVGHLLTRVFALYEDILTARESGQTIGSLNHVKNTWVTIKTASEAANTPAPTP